MLNKQKKKAFTLTELLVVVIVIGVLAAVVLPKYSKVMETRKTTEAEELMAAVRTEQEKRCALDKDYLSDFSKLADILPSTDTKNFTYTATTTGIEARSKGKYGYTLKMPSYADGRLCCDSAEQCANLNKDYPLCSDLIARADYQSGDECAGLPPVIECSGAATQACGCAKAGTQTRTCDTSTGKWSEWSECSVSEVCECTGEKPEETQSCNKCGVQKRTVTCDTTTGAWSVGEWSECDKEESECEEKTCKSAYEDGTLASYCAQYGEFPAINADRPLSRDCCFDCVDNGCVVQGNKCVMPSFYGIIKRSKLAVRYGEDTPTATIVNSDTYMGWKIEHVGMIGQYGSYGSNGALSPDCDFSISNGTQVSIAELESFDAQKFNQQCASCTGDTCDFQAYSLSEPWTGLYKTDNYGGQAYCYLSDYKNMSIGNVARQASDLGVSFTCYGRGGSGLPITYYDGEFCAAFPDVCGGYSGYFKLDIPTDLNASLKDTCNEYRQPTGAGCKNISGIPSSAWKVNSKTTIGLRGNDMIGGNLVDNFNCKVNLNLSSVTVSATQLRVHTCEKNPDGGQPCGLEMP